MFQSGRRHPAKGVKQEDSLPTLVFTTVCTKYRRRALANPRVHSALLAVWRRHVQWIVSAYVVMPDHIHFFAEPGEIALPFDDWVSVWKRGASRLLKGADFRWQAGSFHRIRSYEDAIGKRIYKDENPVRAGLVKQVSDWPYRGEVFRRSHWWP